MYYVCTTNYAKKKEMKFKVKENFRGKIEQMEEYFLLDMTDSQKGKYLAKKTKNWNNQGMSKCVGPLRNAGFKYLVVLNYDQITQKIFF